MLDHIQVSAYGMEQPLKSIAQVVVKSAQLVQVSVFDPELVQPAFEALRTSKMELNPTLEKQTINIPISKPSKESRMEIIKKLKGNVRMCLSSSIRHPITCGVLEGNTTNALLFYIILNLTP